MGESGLELILRFATVVGLVKFFRFGSLTFQRTFSSGRVLFLFFFFFDLNCHVATFTNLFYFICLLFRQDCKVQKLGIRPVNATFTEIYHVVFPRRVDVPCEQTKFTEKAA